MSWTRICSLSLTAFVSLSVFSIDLRAQIDSGVGRKQPRIKEPGGGEKIELNAPSTDDFFQKGRKIFPKSFQRSDEGFRPQADGVGGQVAASYPVGPGDQFLINFWGRIEDNIIVQINSEGKLFIPRVGVIETTGMVYQQLQEAMKAKLDSALKNVSYTISLYRPREFSIYVLGSVGVPGPVPASAKMRASQVIDMAGGVSSTGSKQFIELRRNGEVQRVDLLQYLTEGNFELNPFVTDDDVIFIPGLSEFVTVTGAVVRPGTFEVQETRELDEILKRLGGFSVYADRAAPIRLSRLMPNGERRQLLVHHKAQEGQLSLDEVLVQASDEIFVPSSNLLIPSRSSAVFITGEVKAPGTKPYQISMSVDEYIGSAGGLTSRADFGSAVVYKADGSTVKLEPRMALEPGDTVYIPEKTFKFWQDHLTIITTFISLATSIIVLSGK